MEEQNNLTNLEQNAQLAEKVLASGNHSVSVQTYVPTTGWIHSGQMDASGYIDNDSRLVNIGALAKSRKLVAASGKGLSNGEIFSQKYQTMLENAQKQKLLIDNNPGISAARLIGAAATGNNLIDTDYEVVRRVNYLDGVIGEQYNLADYNAQNVVLETKVSVLNVVGFKKTSALLQGIPEIGDHATPPPSDQTFGTYTKSIYADTFRYEFGMRETKDSVVSLQQELTKEIPGIFARMKDTKVTDLVNAASATAVGIDWDAKGATAGFYDTDAIRDVEADEASLDGYDGPLEMIAPRAVVSAYFTNTGQAGAQSGTPMPESYNPSGRRTGRLTGNPEVGYNINQSITAKCYAVISKNNWLRMLRGPVVNVSYKNQMSPAQTEGRITFDFNGVVEMASSAIRFRNSVLA